MNNQQINAVATADAHLKNAGLPTYSEALDKLSKLHGAVAIMNDDSQNLQGAIAGLVGAQDNAGELLTSIPA